MKRRCAWIRFACHQQGAVLLEFVFITPFVLLLLFGALEVTRYIMITQKVERAGYMLGDSLSQFLPEELTLPAIDTVLQQYYTMMNPHGSSGKQAVIFTSITKDAATGKIMVNWQLPGGGTLVNGQTVSVISNKNISDIASGLFNVEASLQGVAAAELNGSPGMISQENIIVAEIFFLYQPLYMSIMPPVVAQRFNVGERTLVRRTFFHPRNGNLEKIISTQTCALPWGGTIADGAYVTAWKTTTAAPCPGCISEVRVCDKGALSGTFNNQNCDLNWTGITTSECESQIGVPENDCESGGGAFQRGPVSGSCGSEDKLLYTCCGGSSSGANCAAGTANWNGAVSGCSGNYSALAHNASVTVPNTVAGKAGSVTVLCTSGSVSQSGATCTAAASCPAATVNWSGTLSCSKATSGTLASGATELLYISTKIREGYCLARCTSGVLACDPGEYCEPGTGSGSCSTC